jgi:PAS domain S-box-containing protein
MTLLFSLQAQNTGNRKQAVGGIKLSTRLALAMVSLVVVTTAVLSFITYHSVTGVAIPRALDRLVTHARLSATDLKTALNNARQDISMIQGGNGVAQLGAALASAPFIPETATRIRGGIATRLRAVLAAKPDYAQLRIIGIADGGRELVRVDHGGPGGTVRIVPDAELMQIGDRDFFQRAIGQSDIYVSPIALENDGATSRAVPMLHVAIPLWSRDGQPFGLGVIDLNLESKFDRIRADTAGDNPVFISNGAGDYLLNPNRSLEVGSAIGPSRRVQDDFPPFAAAVTGGGNGSGIWKDRNGVWFGVGWEAVRLADGPEVTILVASKYANLDHGLAAVNNSALTGGAVAILLAILLAVAIARSLSRPLVQITRAVEGLSRGELMALPSGGGAEIAVLSSTFADMAAELRQKGALLENTIASIGDPVLVADERGQIVVANVAAQRMLEIAPGSAGRMRKVSYFYPDGVTPMPVSSLALSRALRGESVEEQEFVVQPEAPCVRAYIVATARPLRDESGTLRGAVTVLRNVTEQKRAHQSLVDSEQIAQAIINTALDAFVQLDEAGIILEWSPQAEAMLGWTRSEAVGTNVDDLIVPEFRRAASGQRVRQFLYEVDSGAKGWRFEAPSLHRDGREISTEMSLTALRRGDGYIINAFIRNISQKRAAEEQLIQAQKMESVGQLTGGIAHDFNNMLTVITGTIEILAEAVQHDPQLARIATLISDAADRGSELTANLLAFARKQPLKPVEIDVNALVNEVGRLLSPTLGRQIEIKTALSGEVWPALVDPGQLSSALVNLAINARDAMPDGGTLMFGTSNVGLSQRDAVTCGVDRAGDYVVIEVSDTGTGIPEAIRDKIYDPFFSTKETGRGTGLGLSMVFGFAKQSGGNIEVRSEEGHGTSFRIYLPKADVEALAAVSSADHLPSPGGAETILCVEDDASVRGYVIVQLESLGYKTIAASNAAEALAMVEAGVQFDLLFTDIVMPGKMNGQQLAEQIALRRPLLKVLFTSGYANNTIVRHGRLVPDVRLLTKPYRRAELARMLRLSLDSPLAIPSAPPAV